MEHRSLTAGGSYRNSGRHFSLFTCSFICRTGHFQVWYTRTFKSWMREGEKKKRDKREILFLSNQDVYADEK